MYPAIAIAGQTVSSYVLFAAAGWALGACIFVSESRRRGWPMDIMLLVMVGGAIGGLLGSALLSLLFVAPEARWDASLLPEGRTIIGGIAGGIGGVELTKKLLGHKRSTGAAFALAVPLGHSVGRVGCLLGGCCFGSPAQLPWAITYPAGSLPHTLQISRALIPESALHSLAVHPTPIYEIAFDLALFALLWSWRRRPDAERMLWPTYLAAYASARLVMEFVRGDTLPWSPLGIKPIQLLLLVAATYYAAKIFKGQRPDESPG